MLHYIIQTIAFQLFFLLMYDLFLKKETFFNWNRIYLLTTATLSLILPFIKVDRFKAVVPQDYIISLPEIILGQSSENTNNVILLDAVIIENNAFSFWEILFYVGAAIAFCLFIIKVIKISILVIKNPKQSIGKVVLVELINSNAAFSFFHYIFLGEYIKAEDKDTILKHELIHTQQKHSLDLLFFEVLRIVFWFNPFVYMYQNRLATLHEFIADANALKHQDKEQYYQNLLAQVFETKNISFINTFFKQSLIKKRIVMLSKVKSKQINLFKYVLLIPLVLGMLVYTSAEAQEKSLDKNQDLSQYAYTLNKGEKLVGENKKIHKKYEAFLKKNKNYVSWSHIDRKNNTINYSVHPISEKVPEGFSKSEVSFPDGTSYVTYFNWGVPPPPSKELTEEEKKKKEEALLKSKEKYANATEVPFSVIDQVPIYPGCETLTTEEQKKCISENIAKQVNKNFNTKLATELDLTGRQRINVVFKIDKEGKIIDVRSRGPHPDLETEAIRVIKTLPKMIPGEHNGEKVTVPYSLPIIFQIADKIEKKESELIPLNEVVVPFAVIENVPVFPGCENLASNAEKKKCMSEKIREFVSKNFNTKIANQNGLSGRQLINVIFKIDKKGKIIDIRSRAPHPDLEEEAIRVISSLPKMIPGEHNGKEVTMPYSLPIIFDVKDKTEKLEEVAIVGYTNDRTDGTIPLAYVEKVPVFSGCEFTPDRQEQINCLLNGIKKHVDKKFNNKLVKKLDLIGQQRIDLILKINTEGDIQIERSRATHPDLEAEAIRVIKTLPKMIPGEHKGEKVNVGYFLPIRFQVAN